MLRTYQPKKLHRKKEHGLKSFTERKSTASEKEWLHPTAEKFCPEEEQKAEKGCLIDAGRRLTG